MKQRRAHYRALILSGLLAACGAPPAPSASPPAPPAVPAATALAAPPAPAPLPPISPTGLTLPAKLSGDDPILPPALRSASPPPTARARCTITRAGALSGCQVLEAPADTSALVLAALATWRYRPAHLNGAPVESQSGINVTFALPPAAAQAPPAPAASAAPAPESSAPDAVMSFTEGMNRPTLVSGKNPDYTPEARAAGVEGTVIARCVIMKSGRVRDCKIVKAPPMLGEIVLEALKTQEYTPILFQGKPADVYYVLTFKFRLN
ncbi:MAG: energy transducer TonB [Byssovorax sp.]